MALRQKISYLLKHNEVAQKAYRVVFNTAFRCLGLFVKTDPNLVMFISLMGSRYNDSPRAMYEYMQAHEEYKKYQEIYDQLYESTKDLMHSIDNLSNKS